MGATAEAFEAVRALVRERAAIALDTSKGYLVDARLQPLAKAEGFGTIDAMVSELRRPEREELRRAVVEAMTTNETFWFRDVDVWKAIEKELAERLQRATTISPVRVWSAACSTGQEPYTLSMIARTVAPRVTPVTFRVLATDLDRAAMATAQGGVYNVVEVNRGLPAPHLVRWFERQGTDWRVKDEVRAHVTFREANLSRPLPRDGSYDLVLLRNVLIYFDPEDRRKVLMQVAERLRPGGLLFLGKAEGMHGLQTPFAQIRRHGVVCYQMPGA